MAYLARHKYTAVATLHIYSFAPKTPILKMGVGLAKEGGETLKCKAAARRPKPEHPKIPAEIVETW